MNRTLACLSCRRAYRVPDRFFRAFRCHGCGQRCWVVTEVPKKSKPQDWDTLRRRCTRWETSFARERQERLSATSSSYKYVKREQRQFQPIPEVRSMRKAARKMQQHHKKLQQALKFMR